VRKQVNKICKGCDELMEGVDLQREYCSQCSAERNVERVRVKVANGYKRTKKVNTFCPRCGKGHFLKNADTKIKKNLCPECISATMKSGAYYIEGNERYL